MRLLINKAAWYPSSRQKRLRRRRRCFVVLPKACDVGTKKNSKGDDARVVSVHGYAEVMCHLIFGILTLTANQMLILAT
jgi:hypothetical protein